MGNLDGWGGPLADEWIDKHHALQKQILSRMLELGMIPVLPAFVGFVPAAMKIKYPNAKIISSSGWGGFSPTYYLDPQDPLFTELETKFLARQAQEYGSYHFYSCDLYNEMHPPSSDPSYLSAVSSSLYSALAKVDPDAVWLMQGWLFVNENEFWKEPQMRAFLNAVPKGRLIVLELWADVEPVWKRSQSFFGTPFIWNMLHNFGGRSGIKLHILHFM